MIFHVTSTKKGFSARPIFVNNRKTKIFESSAESFIIASCWWALTFQLMTCFVDRVVGLQPVLSIACCAGPDRHRPIAQFLAPGKI